MATSFLRSISMAVRRVRPSSSWAAGSAHQIPEAARSARELRVANALIAGGTVLMGVGGYSMWADHQVHVMRGDMWAELADLEKTRRTNQEAKANSARENSEPRSPELYRARVTKDFSQSGTWSFNGPVALKNVRVGEIVSVLEEDVGPKDQYILARSLELAEDGTEKEGWYPKSRIEREFQFDGAPRLSACGRGH